MKHFLQQECDKKKQNIRIQRVLRFTICLRREKSILGQLWTEINEYYTLIKPLEVIRKKLFNEMQ